jgi:linoleoyl-CoA desaturase
MKGVIPTEKQVVPKPVFPVLGDKVIFTNLRQEVKKIVSESASRKKPEIILKGILFPLAYVLTYMAALYWGNNITILYSLYCLLGFLLVFVFLNIIHDAVHDTIFENRFANKVLVHFFDLMGANSYIWQLRHVRFHHNYPNVNGWDTDIEQSNLFRVFPDGGYSKMHKYQHIYLPFLYPFYLLNWMLVRDFKDFFNKKKTVRKLVKIPVVEYVKLFVFKAAFLFYILILPKMLLDITWGQAVIAFLVMMFTASIFSLAVLLSPHANTESEFPLPDSNNKLPHSWMMHMLLTTNDVTHDNFFTRFFMGCFNFHVAHHLFPNVNHVYYPEVTKLLKDYAKKYGLPYRQTSLVRSLRDHYRLIKQNKEPVSHIFEETM